MEAHVTGSDLTNTKLDLKYNLIPGCTSLKRYSIYLLAKTWPQNIVKFIENILEDIASKQTPQELKIDGVETKTKLIYEVKAELQHLKKKKQLTKAAINTVLNKYQCQLQECGVKIVQEETQMNHFNIGTDVISASQVSYNYVPNEILDETRESYKRMQTQEYPEYLNYLIPDVSLHESDSQLFSSQPNLNLTSQSDNIFNQPKNDSFFIKPMNTGDENVFDENATAHSNNYYLTPIQGYSSSQSDQLFPVSNLQNFFPSQYTDVPQNSSSEFFANKCSVSINGKTIQNSFDSFSSSLNESKFNMGLADENKKCSTPLWSKALFDDCAINPTKFVTNDKEMQMPMRTNDITETIHDYSISYSPLCASPTTTITNPTPSTSSLLCTQNTAKPKRRLAIRSKFVPPSKLTKRQIEEEFAEQNRKMMESSDSSKISDYAQQICNRPSVKQLQQSEYIACIRRTEKGVVVIPAEAKKKRERKQPFRFNMPYKKVFEPNLLSDANEKKFIEFLEHGKREFGRSRSWDSGGVVGKSFCE